MFNKKSHYKGNYRRNEPPPEANSAQKNILRRLETLENAILDSGGGGLSSDVRLFEERLQKLERESQNKMNETLQAIEEIRNKLQVLEEKCEKGSSTVSGVFENEVCTELSSGLRTLSEDVKTLQTKLDNRLKSRTNESKLLRKLDENRKKSTSKIPDETADDGTVSENAIAELNATFTKASSAGHFIMDGSDRAVVYVKAKIIKAKKAAKGVAIGIWWANEHPANVSFFLEQSVITENTANLKAIIQVLEMAIKFKMQRVRVLSGWKRVVERMTSKVSEIESMEPSDERNLLDYANELTTWLYDTKWCYVAEENALLGMQEAVKLVDSALKSAATETP